VFHIVQQRKTIRQTKIASLFAFVDLRSGNNGDDKAADLQRYAHPKQPAKAAAMEILVNPHGKEIQSAHSRKSSVFFGI
jgi:hypothetical protein